MISSRSYILKEYEIEPDASQMYEDERKIKLIETNYSLSIKKMNKNYLEIDMINLHFSLVNAYRRIVLAEVGTVAIEKVHMYKNTSVVQDEVLAHRLGLIPLNIQPQYFNFVDFNALDVSEYSEENCAKYILKVKCRTSKDPKDAVSCSDDSDCLLIDKLVTTKHLRWIPLGSQMAMYSRMPLEPLREEIPLPEGVGDVNKDIVLAKLNPGQVIHLEAYAFKGIGSDHAKFQPGLCWYRMLPEIKLNRRVLGDDAQLLQRCFSPGVINIKTNDKGESEAVVCDARNDSCSRNVYNYEHLKDAVTMSRRTDHIIFYVESQSAMKSSDILLAAVDVMVAKCNRLLEELSKFEED